MENFRHAFSIHYPYWGGFWGWGRGAKPGTINLRGLCHFCPKKWSNFPSTKKISFVLLNITIVQLIITHINLGGAPWNGTFGFFEQCDVGIWNFKFFSFSHAPLSFIITKLSPGNRHAFKTWWCVSDLVWAYHVVFLLLDIPLIKNAESF